MAQGRGTSYGLYAEACSSFLFFLLTYTYGVLPMSHLPHIVDSPCISNQARVFDKLECLVTKEQLAGSLALSRGYINKLMATEGLPYLKIGRAVRFRVSEVAAWLQKRSQP